MIIHFQGGLKQHSVELWTEIAHQDCLELGRNDWDFISAWLSHWIKASPGRVASGKEALQWKLTLKKRVIGGFC